MSLRLAAYNGPLAYLHQEHGAETRQEAARALSALLNEQSRIDAQVKDLIAAINAAWPAGAAR